MGGIKVQGLDDIAQELEAMLDESTKKRAIQAGLKPLYEKIEGSAPRKTGVLKKSFKAKTLTRVGYVTSSERYAFILEHGSSHTVKHMGYFSNAVAEASGDVLKEIEREVFKW